MTAQSLEVMFQWLILRMYSVLDVSTGTLLILSLAAECIRSTGYVGNPARGQLNRENDLFPLYPVRTKKQTAGPFGLLSLLCTNSGCGKERRILIGPW